MGESKSNTGIKFIDNTVDSVANSVVRPIAQNIEAGHRTSAANWGQIFKGNFNNLGRTLIGGPMEVSGMSMGEVDTQMGRIGMQETAAQRVQREGQEKAATAAAADVAFQAGEKVRAFNSQISGMVANQKRAPGRAQTLITNKANANTLLTLKGN